MKARTILLWPLALIFASAVRLRAWLVDRGVLEQWRLDAKVISVGNLCVGGTGKTPMVLYLAQWLSEEGKRVAILSRGYRAQGRLGSGSEAANAGAVKLAGSDEVALLRRHLPRAAFGVGPNRYARGRDLVAAGYNWVLLDDGFQHLKLARDVDIVLLDATRNWVKEALLPAGRLREPLSALRRADIVVITRAAEHGECDALVRRYTAAPIFHAATRLDAVSSLQTGRILAPHDELRGQTLFAFCGIGNPGAFVADLRRWGLRVAGTAFFRDHHHYTASDIQRVERAARSCGAAAVITTEKDSFNLQGCAWRHFEPLFCRISLRLHEEEQFRQSIRELAGPSSSAGDREQRA